MINQNLCYRALEHPSHEPTTDMKLDRGSRSHRLFSSILLVMHLYLDMGS